MSQSPETPPDSPPTTYLIWSLLATVLCFLPTGLVALYFGIRVNQAFAEGRVSDAQRASVVARRWLVVTAVLGVVIYGVLAATFALLGAFSP